MDILAVSRLRPLMQWSSDPFWQKMFSEAERREAALRNDPLSYFAGRWAAKEAVMKALPSWRNPEDSARTLEECNIEILTGENGEPYLLICGRERNISVSISHEAEYAVAFAVNFEE